MQDIFQLYTIMLICGQLQKQYWTKFLHVYDLVFLVSIRLGDLFEFLNLVEFRFFYSYYGNSKRVARCSQHLDCGKGIVGWKVIYHPQNLIDAFEPYQDRQVRTLQLQSEKVSNNPFLVSQAFS